MTDVTNTNPINEVTAQLATQNATLPNDRIHLIGLFGTADNPQALLRTKNGSTLTVGIDDAVEKGTVVAIDAEKVIVAIGERSDILRMPSVRTDIA